MQFLCKLRILDAAIFDEWADVIPVFLIGFTVSLAHACQLVCNFLGNVFRNLLNKSVILKSTSGYVQWKIRAVDHTFEKEQEFRNDFLDIVCDKYLVVIQFDGSLDGIIFCVDLREVQDTFEVERIIHVQMDPEQWLLVIHKYFTVEILVILVAAFIRMSHPQRIRIT